MGDVCRMCMCVCCVLVSPNSGDKAVLGAQGSLVPRLSVQLFFARSKISAYKKAGQRAWE